MSKREETIGYTLRIPFDLAEQLRQSAEEDSRSMNQQIEYLLTIGLKEQERRKQLIKLYEKRISSNPFDVDKTLFGG